MTATAATTPAPMPAFSSKVNTWAVKSGNASDPAVWSLGRLLEDNDFFGIPAGMTIVWDLTSSPNLAGRYIKGTLDLGSAPGDKVCNLVTSVVDSGGSLLCGSCKNNVPATGTYTQTFLDVAPDPAFDPGQFGTGELWMGATVDMCGSANKDGWLWCQSIKSGDTTITLNSTPNDWNSGDFLLLPNADSLIQKTSSPYNWYAPAHDEVVTIASVVGNVITLTKPVQYAHQAMPGPQGQANYVPVGNLSRRVIFQSANPNGTRGHIMHMRDMMGNPSIVNTCHVLLKDLGRTDAMSPVTDPMVDASGALIPGTAANPRARYAWHSHRQGQDASALQTWDTLVVWGYKKWAYDNHDSNVYAINLIAHDGQGAAFATERGSEIGSYTNCLGNRTSGSGAGIDDRKNVDDFGHQGSGIWLQGVGVTCSDNVLCNHATQGIIADPAEVPIQGTVTNVFSNALLPQLSWAGPGAQTSGTSVLRNLPMFGLSGNLSFCNGAGGLLLWQHEPRQPYQQGPVINHNSWGELYGIILDYAQGYITLDGKLSGGIIKDGVPVGNGITINVGYVQQYAIASTIQVANYFYGAVLPQTFGAICSLGGGYWNNVRDFWITSPELGDGWGKFQFENAPVFGTLTPTQLDGQTRYNYYWLQGFDQQPWYSTLSEWLTKGIYSGKPDLNLLFSQVPNTAFYYYPTLLLSDGRQVYAAEQAADFVPCPSNKGIVYPATFPTELLDKTNIQLWMFYGLSVGGALCTVTSSTGADPSTNGLIGPPATYPAPWLMTSAVYPVSTSYVLTVKHQLTKQTQSFPSVTLQSGWQRLTQIIGGQLYSFFVFGPGTTSPPPSPPPPPVTFTQSIETTVGTSMLRNVTLVDTIVASDGSVPVGSVSFVIMSGTTMISAETVTLSMGVASVPVVLPVGSYTVQATYNGQTTSQSLVVS